MIIAENLSKSFKTKIFEKAFVALDDVSFRLKEGSTTGFLGANGAGKTTTIKTLFKFIFPDSGRIYFSSTLGKNHSETLKNVGFLPERPYFYGDLVARDFILYMASISGMKKSEIHSRTKLLSEKLKIDHALDRKVRSYSKGMLQRLGFLSAIIHDPKLIILDEPMAGLDPLGRKEFKDIMTELSSKGKTVFFSSHIVSDIEEICDELVVLQKGKLIYEGELKELMEKHFYTDYLFKLSQEVDWLKKDVSGQYYLVSKSEKQQVLKKILDENIEMDYFIPNSPNLEKVVYELEKTN